MRRSLALVGLLFLLTGCGGADQRAAFTESRIPPALAPRFWAPEGWAWGLLQIGEAPAQRYGVASTPITPRASILILTGYGESAEAWFETVRDLNALGYSVWVLERAAQGGSARYVSPRDLGHAPGFGDDIAATRTLARMIVAAAPDAPLVVLGASTGGLVGLAALQQGAPADGLVLSSPDLESDEAAVGWRSWLTRVGLGRLPQGPGYGWAREGPDGFQAGLTHDRQRGAVQKAWQLANPDLRMGEPSLGWRAAFAETSGGVGGGLERLATPALLLAAGDDADRAEGERACAALPTCRSILAAGARPALHLERDSVRRAWLAAIDGFIRERAAARAAPTPSASDHRL